MTTPPQGPWGPGQPGGQPGGQHGGQGGSQQPPQQGGWGQQPPGQGGGWGQPPQQPQGQPPHGRPPQQDRPQQGWGQQPGQPGQPGQQGQPGQPAGGWGQPPQQGGGAYQQQSWGQRQQQGPWHQQQGGQPGQWQPGGPGGKGPGGISKDKLPFVIGGGVVGVILIGLLVFLGVRAFSGDDTPTTQPTIEPTGTGEPTGGNPTESPTSGPANGELGNATGQAKAATEKLQGIGFACSDLFNTAQGAHRGCFKSDGRKDAEAILQFGSDGNIVAVRVQAQDSDNNNNAQVAFDQVLQAVGNDAFGADSVKKVQAAVKTGQRSEEVSTSWGDLQLSNSGESLRLSGKKSGEDSLDLPDQNFDTTQAQLTAALKAKGYVCTSSCKKEVGQYGSQRVYSYARSGEGIKDIEVSVYGEGSAVKNAMNAVVNDTFGVLKGGNAAAVKSYIQAHSDGKPYAAYVGGWKVEIDGSDSSSYKSQRISIRYESFYA
ncbi:PT domain-containing protein [Kribbella shirazensis]|uniref:Uncharacterized protein n=1 Tax=Kribbella shirazensis TaxID=1105143 RepID=A0A7X6A1J8_9ACTN|nr:PT domain-containing protein [Kribbella shirazensis]NIK57920.1 hypothetical protein [Kribbella shirazensis]